MLATRRGGAPEWRDIFVAVRSVEFQAVAAVFGLGIVNVGGIIGGWGHLIGIRSFTISLLLQMEGLALVDGRGHDGVWRQADRKNVGFRRSLAASTRRAGGGMRQVISGQLVGDVVR